MWWHPCPGSGGDPDHARFADTEWPSVRLVYQSSALQPESVNKTLKAVSGRFGFPPARTGPR